MAKVVLFQISIIPLTPFLSIESEWLTPVGFDGQQHSGKIKIEGNSNQKKGDPDSAISWFFGPHMRIVGFAWIFIFCI